MNCMLANVISLKYNVLIFKKYLDFSCKHVHFKKVLFELGFFEGFLSGFFWWFFYCQPWLKY
jgi:hypothetical protein